MAYSLWDVSGKVLIPGTRKSATLPTMRVCAADRQAASRQLAALLNEKFRRELRGETFSPHFAMMHLMWVQVGK